MISNLLSPRDNPHWFWLPSAGVALAGACMLPLGAWIEQQLGDAGSRRLARRVRGPLFVIGVVCLVMSAIIVPQHVHLVLGLRHVHELLARTAAMGLGLGMLFACWSLGAAAEAMEDSRARRLRVLRRVWWPTTLLPIMGAIGSGIIVALGKLQGAGAAAFFRGTVFWHLAFWEWAGSVAVFIFFAGPVLILGRDGPATRPVG